MKKKYMIALLFLSGAIIPINARSVRENKPIILIDERTQTAHREIRGLTHKVKQINEKIDSLVQERDKLLVRINEWKKRKKSRI